MVILTVVVILVLVVVGEEAAVKLLLQKHDSIVDHIALCSPMPSEVSLIT